jgi:hypothetical protein
MHPGEILGDLPGLVSLQTADEMPGEFAPRERLYFGQGFLQEILAEVLDARARGSIDCCAALAFRNGQKRDRVDTSTSAPAGLCDAGLSDSDALRAILRTGLHIDQ